MTYPKGGTTPTTIQPRRAVRRGQQIAQRHGPTLGHRPQLDGVRALAFVAVFVGHAGLTRTPGIARIAMFLFFGLSGFLITSLLSEEERRRESVSLPRFFARRGLRLVPALAAFLALWLLAVVFFGSQSWMTTVPGTGLSGGQSLAGALRGAGAALFYFSNWTDIVNGMGDHLALGHLWSLAVEEQFYLIFAPMLALLLVSRRRLCMGVTAGLAAASVILAVWYQHLGWVNWNYMGTGARAGAFLLGGAFALAWQQGRLSFLRSKWTGNLLIAASAAALLLAAPRLVWPSSLPEFATYWTVATIAGPLLVVAAVEQATGPFRWILAAPVLTYVGRRSYALYLWHYLFLTWFRDLGHIGIWIALALTFLAAEVSWRLVEAPCLRLKSRFSGPGQPKPLDLHRLEPIDLTPVGVDAGARSAVDGAS